MNSTINKFALLFTAVFFASSLSINAQTTLLSQDFEAGFGIPTGWTKSEATGSTGFKFGYNSTIQSSYFAIPFHGKMSGTNDDKCNCDASLDYLITPEMDLSSLNTVYLSYACFFQGSSYQSQTEKGFIEIRKDSNSPWEVVTEIPGASSWMDYIVDLSAYTSYSTAQIGFHYDDDGGYLYGLAIDDVKVYEPLTADVAMKTVEYVEFVDLTAQTITGTFFNNSSAAITSFDLNYSLNSAAPLTQSYSGINIPSLGTYTYTHQDIWSPDTPGAYIMKVWVSNINGVLDQDNSNDTITVTVNVVSGLMQRTVLCEEFTNASCGPCAGQNPAYNALLESNIKKVSIIKYQTDFPGTDPMNAYNPADAGNRQTYYAVSGVPTGFYDGVSMDGPAGYDGAPANLTQAMIDEKYAQGSLFDIFVTETRDGNDVSVSVQTTSKYDLNVSNLKVHIIIVEKDITYTSAPGSNGEKEFSWIMRKMLPTNAGTNIGAQTTGQVSNVNGSYTIASPLMYDQMRTVVFIQNHSTKEVYQSAMHDFFNATTGIIKASADYQGDKLELVPSVVNSQLNSRLFIQNQSDGHFEIRNMMGQLVEVFQGNVMSSGIHSSIFSVGNLSNGIYTLNYVGTSQILSEKFVIVR